MEASKGEIEENTEGTNPDLGDFPIFQIFGLFTIWLVGGREHVHVVGLGTFLDMALGD